MKGGGQQPSRKAAEKRGCRDRYDVCGERGGACSVCLYVQQILILAERSDTRAPQTTCGCAMTFECMKSGRIKRRHPRDERPSPRGAARRTCAASQCKLISAVEFLRAAGAALNIC